MSKYDEMRRKTRLNKRSADAMDLLRELGFAFAVDFDDSLIVDAPVFINPQSVVDLLMEGPDTIVWRVLREQREQRRFLHGGPCHGQRAPDGIQVLQNGRWFEKEPRWHFQHVGRAQWAVYRIEHDGRGFYVQDVTSRLRAKHLAQRLTEEWRAEQEATA